MPSTPRSVQIDLDATPYYHCVSRCVRRAFLCGTDPYTGENFDHRKEWFRARLKLAAEVFAIDVCAYAILSNHFHTVLRVDADRAAEWSDEAVLRRYGRLFRFAAKEVRALPKGAERTRRIEILRGRLCDISWFMRIVNEFVARKANAEDECTGHFWEGRFKSQPLLDDTALYTCMSYVDLNPVRAGVSTTLAGSAFTSIEQRLREVDGAGSTDSDIELVPLAGDGRPRKRGALSFRWDDYLELLEWTGRAAGAKPGGRIRGNPPAVLEAMRIDHDAWLATMTRPGLGAMTSVGAQVSMSAEASRRGKRWLKGAKAARALFETVA